MMSRVSLRYKALLHTNLSAEGMTTAGLFET
jgi:hypothetical protein